MGAQRIVVTGGTGFIGSHLVNKLVGLGHDVTVVTRRPERHRDFRVGSKVRLATVDLSDTGQMIALLAGCDCVINLVGILNEQGSSTFSRAHVELPRLIVKAMRESGVSRLLHMSALNADVNETRGRYLKTKGEGENLVHQSPGIDVTSFRPSVVFGPGDSFFRRFASLLKLAPTPLFPLACADARFAPVYVGDVADAFVHALNHRNTIGQRLELCGPSEYTLKQLVEYTGEVTGLHTRVIGLPDFAARLQGHIMGLLPGKPFTIDNYYSLKKDSVCSRPAFSQMNIEPRSVEAVVPTYLGSANSRARYYDYRSQARRSP
ncbi:MAG: complex I NDUFA9 subunit family protein [Thiogranum sp.]